jgi:hypothetical protein
VPSRAALCLWGYGWVSAHTPYSNLGAYCIKVQYDGVPSTEWDLKKKFEGKWRKKIKFCWVPNWDTRQKLGYTGCQLQTFGEDSFTECWIHDTRQTSNTICWVDGRAMAWWRGGATWLRFAERHLVFCRVFFGLAHGKRNFCRVSFLRQVFYRKLSAKILFVECLKESTWQTRLHSATLEFPIACVFSLLRIGSFIIMFFERDANNWFMRNQSTPKKNVFTQLQRQMEIPYFSYFKWQQIYSSYAFSLQTRLG